MLLRSIISTLSPQTLGADFDRTRELHSYALFSENNDLPLQSDILYVAEHNDLPEQWVVPPGICVLLCTCREQIQLTCPPQGLLLPCLLSVEAALIRLKELWHNDALREQCRQQLLDILFHGGTLQQLLNEGRRILSRPLILEDAGRNVVTLTADAGPYKLLLESPRLVAPFSYRRDISPNEQPHSSARKNSEVEMGSVLQRFREEGISPLTSVIFQGSRPILFLSALQLPGDPDFTSTDKVILDQITEILELETQKEKYQYLFTHYDYEILIRDLLSGKIDETDLPETLLYKGHPRVKRNLHLLLIRCGGTAEDARWRAEVLTKLKKAADYHFHVMNNSNLLVLLDSGEQQELHSEAKNTIRSLLASMGLHGSLSGCFHSLNEIRKAYYLALKTLEFGMVFDEAQSLCDSGSYALFHILHSCQDIGFLRTLICAAWLLLEEEDAANGTEYLQTALCFSECLHNHKATAAALHISPSTLVYRLNRIQKILGAELDPELGTQLILSARVADYLKKYSGLSLSRSVQKGGEYAAF